MNIKFVISKNPNEFVKYSTYNFKILHINNDFLKKLKSTSIVCVSFKDKKIFKTENWDTCRISNETFSFHITNNNTQIEARNNTEKFLMLHLNVGSNQIIKTDIKDFDKIFIKAFKVLSDTYNNYER